jgi:hypothetical protein
MLKIHSYTVYILVQKNDGVVISSDKSITICIISYKLAGKCRVYTSLPVFKSKREIEIGNIGLLFIKGLFT